MTCKYKSNMIYVRTQEGLYHNKINSTPFLIHTVTVKWAIS